MLERIHNLKGIGLLHDASGQRYRLQSASFIYADNGRGKSTLASIFRSCSTNNPDLILNRKTIDGANDPEVSLQFSNGQRATFQNGIWDQSHPELLVFDADFVEQNVYAGGQVTSDQRKNLLSFALGANAVVAQREYDIADTIVQEKSSKVRVITNNLDLIHRGLALSEFQDIVEVPDADSQIAILNEQIVEAQNVGQILRKALPSIIDTNNFNIEPFFKILSMSVDSIDLAAEEKVKSHLEKHKIPGLESWVSDGYAFGVENTCPFCDQPLEGLQLLQAYRSFFNHNYNQLKQSVSELSTLISTLCSDAIVDNIKAKYSTSCVIIDGWKEHLELNTPEFNESQLRLLLNEIKEYLEGLKTEKETHLLDAIGTEADKEFLLGKWQDIINIIEESNRTISNSIELIEQYRSNLTAVDIEILQERIKQMEWAKIRYRQDVIDLFTELSSTKTQELAAKTEKQLKKDALNQIMQTTLENYKVRINELLRSFGAQFIIPNIDFNYRGSLRSDYVLQMRGTNIALSGGVPDFKTSLSESDKRTLAFAFFIASVESDPNLSTRIVIIDDPMCSLDLNRKQQTRTVIKRIHERCHQMIVLAHDVHFLRNLKNDVLKSSHPNFLSCLKLKAVSNRYSDFDDVNFEQECESSYFKSHRVLGEYMNGTTPSSMDVARSIRPMLEGYLHRRFPGLINKGLLFGEVINQINCAQRPSPLIHAQNITSELNEINLYAGQFHHDTNPAADQVQIVDGELLAFVERAVKVIHAGTS